MKPAHYLVAFVLSGLVILASVFVPGIVFSRSDMAQVKLGAPVPFVVQDHSRYYDPSVHGRPHPYDPSLPWRVRFDASLEVSTRILWPQLLLDVALVFGALVIILRVTLAASSLLPQRSLDLLPQFLQPPRSEPKKPVYHLVVLMLSGLLVLASLWVPVTVSSKIDLAQMKLGLPLAFVIQNQSSYDPPFPWQFNFQFDPWEIPTWILWPQFLLDVAIVFGAITVIIRVTKAVVLRTLPPRRQ